MEISVPSVNTAVYFLPIGPKFIGAKSRRYVNWGNNMKDPIFFGHWRHMLKLAREQAKNSPRREADRLSCHSASIILSKTCLEIYLNEFYFIQIHERNFSERDTYFSKKKKRMTKLGYKNFVDLHICERLEVSLPAVSPELMADVSLQNQIRNYCIHYTASDVKQQLELEFRAHPVLGGIFEFDVGSLQEMYINDKTALWCNNVSLKAIITIEEGQSKANSNSEIYIQNCLEIMDKG
ncbi:hypothetical protein DFR52_102639 [Hoeflea marina]|uniref:Uncharacterized protein n=1 Tax=Hoeflea marina TaxID=274592 RepID=A0A317PT28_9HYPH|nr:hypothetical protein [Hoeflea marina]PWW01974.1 hypothetical protein DFR52_102639 [Hoeflea marina]